MKSSLSIFIVLTSFTLWLTEVQATSTLDVQITETTNAAGAPDVSVDFTDLTGTHQFANGFNGCPISVCDIDSGPETLHENFFSAIPSGVIEAGRIYTVNLLEPGSGSLISDALQIFIECGAGGGGCVYAVDFRSDGLNHDITFPDPNGPGQPVNGGVVINVVEVEGAVTPVIFPILNETYNVTAGILSDFDPPAAVPEPTSLGLLTTGLAGLAIWRRTKQGYRRGSQHS